MYFCVCMRTNTFDHLKQITVADNISTTNEKEQFRTIIKLKWIEKKF